MKKILFTALMIAVGVVFSHTTSAGNTQIGLVILGSGETLSGSTSGYFPPVTGTTNTGTVSTGSVNTGTNNGGGGAGAGAGAGGNIGVPSIPILPIPNPGTGIIEVIPPVTGLVLTGNMSGETILPIIPGGDNSYNTAVSIYGEELVVAYNYAKSVGITNTKSIDTARIHDPITRGEVAKMIVEYVKNVKKQPIETIPVCNPENYKDVNDSMRQAPYIGEICSIYVMGWKNDGKQIIEQFRLNDALTRAEFGTVLSRYLYGTTYMGDTSTTYYVKHLEALREAKIMNQINKPENRELRGNIMIMLHRLSK